MEASHEKSRNAAVADEKTLPFADGQTANGNRKPEREDDYYDQKLSDAHDREPG